MKNYLLSSLLLLIFLPPGARSQTEDIPPMVVMWENEIPPSMVAQYEEVAKKELAIFRKFNFPRSYYVYRTEDYHYWWVMIFKDLNDYEQFGKEFWSILERMEKEEGFNFNQEFSGKTNFMKPIIIQWLPNLSNMPQGTMKFSQAQYFRWGLCYVKVGFEDEALQNWGEWVKLFKDNEIDIGWNLYSGILGTENPFLMWGEVYESPLDMETQRAATFGKITDQSNKLWNEMLQYLRKFEIKTGWYLPDLSYVIINE